MNTESVNTTFSESSMSIESRELIAVFASIFKIKYEEFEDDINRLANEVISNNQPVFAKVPGTRPMDVTPILLGAVLILQCIKAYLELMNAQEKSDIAKRERIAKMQHIIDRLELDSAIVLNNEDRKRLLDFAGND